MNETKLIEILVESGIPEDKVQEMVDAFKQNMEVFQRQDGDKTYEHEPDTHTYLYGLYQNETDWKKRAAIAAAIASRNLGA